MMFQIILTVVTCICAAIPWGNLLSQKNTEFSEILYKLLIETDFNINQLKEVIEGSKIISYGRQIPILSGFITPFPNSPDFQPSDVIEETNLGKFAFDNVISRIPYYGDYIRLTQEYDRIMAMCQQWIDAANGYRNDVANNFIFRFFNNEVVDIDMEYKLAPKITTKEIVWCTLTSMSILVSSFAVYRIASFVLGKFTKWLKLRNALTQVITKELKIPQDMKPMLESIKKEAEKSGVTVDIPIRKGPTTITGPKIFIDRLEKQLASNETRNLLNIPNRFHTKMFGAQFLKVLEIQKECGVIVKVPQKGHNKCITVTGPTESIEKAEKIIRDLHAQVMKNPFAKNTSLSEDTKDDSSSGKKMTKAVRKNTGRMFIKEKFK